MATSTNRLINEKSPYLLQHAYNPVDWFPWSEEAFTKAHSEDKPVFLSIGYSTCHWCHVMEHESFEDPEVTKLMNDTFISIKVDREERPDIDGIYMTVCQMLTGSGGWPLTIIMTPDKKPFFAGTYFPKTGRFNRIGMMELIPKIKELWNTKREEINKSAGEITTALNKGDDQHHNIKLTENIFENAFHYFSKSFDEKNGGFGNVPKFPTPHNLMFLLRYWKRKNSAKALKMVETTLKKMRLGGIYDQIGFGFHRYSTDSKWLVPHFEKMLYDQALLCLAYTETFLATKNKFYKDTAEEILTYVMRDMTSPEGGFYSAEDADSEGEEGKFYLWEEKELKDILGEDASVAVKIYNVDNAGNWFDSSKGMADGTNILHLQNDFENLVGESNITRDEMLNKINNIREKLFNRRKKRVHPLKDDKILTDWNGLMISAFAKAYQAFGNENYLSAAEKAADFILTSLQTNEGKLLHRYRNGEAGITANLDDYAFLINALIDLYESSFNLHYLKNAIKLNEYLIDHFWDSENGGFFFTSNDGENLLVRQKEIYDGAVPSGNSVAMLNLIKLGRITGNSELENKADNIAQTFSNSISNSPFAFTQTLIATDFAFSPSYEIVLAGNKNSDDTNLFLNKLRDLFIPNKILILNDNDEIKKISAFTSSQNMIDGKAVLYVCRNFICNLPVTSIDEVDKLFP